MRKTGARLTLPEAMNQHCNLGPVDISDSRTSSSSLAKAEREIKNSKGFGLIFQTLQQENRKLKTELTDIRSLYRQLVEENSHERFDERRVTLLKSQVIQLERQILLLSEALSSRGAVLLEVENALQWMADKCRIYITTNVRGPHVSIDRSDLTLMVETAESARIKLYKQIANNTTEQLSVPLRFYNDFVQVPADEKEISFIDIASGNLEHLNLKHISKLETKLSSLYRELIHLYSSMEVETTNQTAYLWTSCHVTKAVRERLMTQILKSCALMKDCSSDLLDLSLLFPSAPWPPLKRCALVAVSADRVIRCLPSVSRSSEGQKVIHDLVKAFNYKVYMLQTEIEGLKEEVKYHQNVYNLQLKYTESIFQAFREAYSDFEETNQTVIVRPLKEILKAYEDLSLSASEVSLKNFVQKFKDHALELSNIVDSLAVKSVQKSDGSKVLSQFGEEFFEAMEKLVAQQQDKRDKEATRMDSIRLEQEKLDHELGDLLHEKEQHTQTSSALKTNASLFSSTDEIQVEKQLENAVVEEVSCIKNNKKKVKDKVLRKSQWVDILAVDQTEERVKDVKDTDVERTQSRNLSNEELYRIHRKAILENDTQDVTHEEKHLSKELHCDMKTTSVNPLTHKSKTKLGYIPNTFVPSKTLHLQRTGSLTMVQSSESNVLKNDVSEETFRTSINEKKDQNAKTSSAKVSKSKPAFR